MEEEKKEKNREKDIVIIMLIVIIIILLCFFLVRHLGMIETKIPTGNVDIFDITFIEKDNDSQCCGCCNGGSCSEECNCPNKYLCDGGSFNNATNFNNSTNSNGNFTNTNVDTSISNGITIYDEKIEYANTTPLQIFEHKSYQVKNDVIAPETENSYQFVIRNNNSFAIIYDLIMDETNDYNINMKYRLQRDGKYVLGNNDTWVTAQELKQSKILLANDSYNVYTLDWKWFESDNDTEIGENVESNYQLNISFYANRY